MEGVLENCTGGDGDHRSHRGIVHGREVCQAEPSDGRRINVRYQIMTFDNLDGERRHVTRKPKRTTLMDERTYMLGYLGIIGDWANHSKHTQSSTEGGNGIYKRGMIPGRDDWAVGQLDDWTIG